MASNVYYKLPLQLSEMMEGKDAPTCDLGASISKNIELIIMTRFGEHRSDPTFGCEIWDLDFELIVSQGLWEKKLCNSILQSITSHENRLTSVDVSVMLTEIEKLNAIMKYPEIKKKVEIRLKAVVKKTGEGYNFTANLFLSPLSLD
ncbi:MAG: hypothetical protein JWQ40_4409 [Segetibacter sp.]|jgi:phage baseplate assembly protein W|nr:hypothetical protein [Segetibacter sp.]